MKSFLYIFTFIIAICSSVQSQNFNIEYGLPLPSAEECIGKAFEYKWHYVSLISSRSGSITKYSIIKINQNGDIVDTINLQDTTVFTCIDWVQGSDGYYYILTKETKNGEAYTL